MAASSAAEEAACCVAFVCCCFFSWANKVPHTTDTPFTLSAVSNKHSSGVCTYHTLPHLSPSDSELNRKEIFSFIFNGVVLHLNRRLILLWSLKLASRKIWQAFNTLVLCVFISLGVCGGSILNKERSVLKPDRAVPSSGAAAAKRGPSQPARLYMHSSPAVVKGSWLTKAHTAAFKKRKKKNQFPPQSEECLSVVSSLPWKHMVWFRCFGCTRGELKEKSYDHKNPNGWLDMWVSSSKFCFVLAAHSSDKIPEKTSAALLCMFDTFSSEMLLMHTWLTHIHTQTSQAQDI